MSASPTSDKPTVVFITGATGLLGAAIARRFARTGATVCLGYLEREAEARALAESLSSSCVAIPVQLDVAREESVEAAMKQIADGHGGIDVLVYAAGVMRQKYLRFCTQADLEATFGVNLFGAIYCSRAVLPYMSRKGRGRIVLVGSRSAASGMVGYTLYTSSKAALSGLCRSASKEYAAMGITVNVVAPAKLEGPSSEPADEALKLNYPMKRFVHPDEIAETVLFLASDGAASITGETIHVDGASRL